MLLHHPVGFTVISSITLKSGLQLKRRILLERALVALLQRLRALPDHPAGLFGIEVALAQHDIATVFPPRLPLISAMRLKMSGSVSCTRAGIGHGLGQLLLQLGEFWVLRSLTSFLHATTLSFASLKRLVSSSLPPPLHPRIASIPKKAAVKVRFSDFHVFLFQLRTLSS
jgi:hypothetical protein